MKSDSLADRAHIALALRKLSDDELRSRTIATGIASSTELATATIRGMWFFLGVEVDPQGMLQQRVQLIELQIDKRRCHVLLACDGRRAVAYSFDGESHLLAGLEPMGLEIHWEPFHG